MFPSSIGGAELPPQLMIGLKIAFFVLAFLGFIYLWRMFIAKTCPYPKHLLNPFSKDKFGGMEWENPMNPEEHHAY